MDIKNAAHTAQNMGRTTTPISTFKMWKQGHNHILFMGKFEGTKDTHKAQIMWVAETGKRKRLDVLGTKERQVTPCSCSGDVQVHCSCPDYTFTFYPAIKDHGSHYKVLPPAPPPKTGRTRAIKELGLCKHLLALHSEMIRSKLLLIKD